MFFFIIYNVSAYISSEHSLHCSLYHPVQLPTYIQTFQINSIPILRTGVNFEHYPAGSRLVVVDPNRNFKSYYDDNKKKFPHIEAEDFIVTTGVYSVFLCFIYQKENAEHELIKTVHLDMSD